LNTIYSARMDRAPTPSRLTCPQCRSRLTVLDMDSGARIVFVAMLGFSVERSAKALESLLGPGTTPDVKCPACEEWMNRNGSRSLGS
jgi:hypothetical protein